jgi:indolepyruvate ferredoxin oxidoreductase, beta subunit
MKTIRIIMVAVGGQGNLLASKVLGEAALLSGISFRMSEIHGMAQRGGVVESAIVLGNSQSPIISDGEAEILLGFEPSETARALNKCNKNSYIITNIAPIIPFTVAIGRGKYPDIADLQNLIKEKVSSFMAFDALALAKEAGNVMALNMVLLGALSRANVLPISKENFEKAISATVKKNFVDLNLKAFNLGFAAA